MSGLFIFILVSVFCILGLGRPYLGFTFAFVSKYVTEIIFNLVIIFKYGKFKFVYIEI